MSRIMKLLLSYGRSRASRASASGVIYRTAAKDVKRFLTRRGKAAGHQKISLSSVSLMSLASLQSFGSLSASSVCRENQLTFSGVRLTISLSHKPVLQGGRHGDPGA